MQSHVASILNGGTRSWLLWTCSFAFLIIAQQFILQNSSTMASILAGAITGVFETLLMYPIENLKTQQQLFVAAAASAGASNGTDTAPTLKQVVTVTDADGMCGGVDGAVVVTCATNASAINAGGDSLYNTRANLNAGGPPPASSSSSSGPTFSLGSSPSLMSVFRRTLAVHGFRGLYRGMSPTLFCAVPNQALRWGAFDTSCALLGCHDSIIAVCVAGMITGAAVSLITGVPVETIKTLSIHASMGRLTREDSDVDTTAASTPVPSRLSVKSFLGSAGGASTNHATPAHHRPQQRPSGGGGAAVPETVVLGVLPTILKKVGNQAVRFPVHRLMMDFLCASTAAAVAAGSLTLAPGKSTYGICGVRGTGGPAAGFLAGVVAGTASIFATQPIDVIKTRMQSIGAERYGHTWQCGARLLREEGVGVFLNGLGARALRSGLGAGFSFAFYPLVKAMLVAAHDGTSHIHH